MQHNMVMHGVGVWDHREHNSDSKNEYWLGWGLKMLLYNVITLFISEKEDISTSIVTVMQNPKEKEKINGGRGVIGAY